jgi:hypothetical protein
MRKVGIDRVGGEGVLGRKGEGDNMERLKVV